MENSNTKLTWRAKNGGGTPPRGGLAAIYEGPEEDLGGLRAILGGSEDDLGGLRGFFGFWGRFWGCGIVFRLLPEKVAQ